MSQGWDGAPPRNGVGALRDRASGANSAFRYAPRPHRQNGPAEGARLSVERMRSIAGKRTPQFIVGDMNATAGTPGGVCLEPISNG
ncbi:MAG: hypothetical protein ACLRMJ_03630 [Alistipes finegoldii]